MKILLAALVAIAGLSGSVLAQNEKPAATDTHVAAKAKPPIYDEKTDGATLINAALAKAAKNNRRVMVQWGANWCPWCHLLHETMGSDKDIKHEVLYEYDVVLIDVGRFDRNMDLAAKYGAELQKTGIPYITVLDSAGKVVTNQETGSLESKEAGKHEHDRAAVLKFMKDHEATPLVADDVLRDGLSKAKTANKRVFLHFGAPWCGWCHRLEDWMAKSDIAPVIDRTFVDVKIDIDRDRGAKEVFAKYNADSEKSGIPWFAIVDGDGKVLATSTGPKGNTGYPGSPEEIEHFASMLKAAGMSESDIGTLVASLKSGSPSTR